MSALSDFLAEIRKQDDLIDYASSMDDHADRLNFYPDLLAARQGRRRRWTRQDRRRIDQQSDISVWNEQEALARKQGNEPPPFPIGDDERIGRSRCQIMLHRLLLPNRQISHWRERALLEARENGTYGVVCNLIITVADAHHKMLEAFLEGVESDGQIDLGGPEQKSRRDRAMQRLELHDLPEKPPVASEVSSGGGSAQSDDSPRSSKPSWNKEVGKLMFNGVAIREVKNLGSAKNVVAVLDAFQDQEWPTRIESPFTGGRWEVDPRQRTAAILSLNKGLVENSPLKFEADGTGNGIRWIIVGHTM